MKLYYSAGTCSLATHIVLIEAGLNFSIVRVDLQSKVTESGDYWKINPKGSVPALALDSGEILTEGAAILQYVADLAPGKKLIPPAGTFARSREQEWLNYVATEVHKNFSVLFNAGRYVTNPEGNAQLIEAIKGNLHKRFALLNTRLETNPYLMGETFSVADAYLFTVLRWSKGRSVDMSPFPALMAYMARIKERPSVMQAMRAETPKT